MPPVVGERISIPVVCDLTDAPDTAEERIAEYRRLFTEHLVAVSIVDGVVRFHLRAGDGVEAWVRDLMAREQRCCGFFEFSLHAQDGEIVWHARVDDDAATRAMLDEWARLPQTVAGGTAEVRDRWTARRAGVRRHRGAPPRLIVGTHAPVPVGTVPACGSEPTAAGPSPTSSVPTAVSASCSRRRAIRAARSGPGPARLRRRASRSSPTARPSPRTRCWSAASPS